MPTQQRAGAHLRRRQRGGRRPAAQEFGTGVLTDDDPGRRRRARAADAIGCGWRPATPTCRTRRRRSARPARRWSAPRCTTPGTALREQLIAMAVGDDESPLHGADPGAVTVADGRMHLAARPDAARPTASCWPATAADAEALGSWRPPPLDTPHGLLTFGAQFAEVAVDPELGLVRVRRLVGVFAPGRVLNPKLARSQLMGGMLWGLGPGAAGGQPHGSANRPLGREQPRRVPGRGQRRRARRDRRVRRGRGRPWSTRSASRASARSARSGSAAAIANAVFHATGRRQSASCRWRRSS